MPRRCYICCATSWWRSARARLCALTWRRRRSLHHSHSRSHNHISSSRRHISSSRRHISLRSRIHHHIIFRPSRLAIRSYIGNSNQSQSQHQQQQHHSQSTGLYGSSGSLTQAIPLPSGPPPSYQASRLESRHRLQQRTKQQLDAFVAKAQADLAQTKALDEQIQRLAQEKEQLTVQTQQLAAETAAIRQWLETHGAAAEFDIDRATQADTPIKIQYARASRASILCVRCEVC